jgi:hypothetical protein
VTLQPERKLFCLCRTVPARRDAKDGSFGGLRGTLSATTVDPWKTRSTGWLKVGDEYKLSPYRCESRQAALRHGMEHVLDRELVAVFSEDVGLSIPQMLELAPMLPPPGSALMRPPGQ